MDPKGRPRGGHGGERLRDPIPVSVRGCHLAPVVQKTCWSCCWSGSKAMQCRGRINDFKVWQAHVTQGSYRSVGWAPELLLKMGGGHSGKLHPGSCYPRGGGTSTDLEIAAFQITGKAATFSLYNKENNSNEPQVASNYSKQDNWRLSRSIFSYICYKVNTFFAQDHQKCFHKKCWLCPNLIECTNIYLSSQFWLLVFIWSLSWRHWRLYMLWGSVQGLKTVIFQHSWW